MNNSPIEIFIKELESEIPSFKNYDFTPDLYALNNTYHTFTSILREFVNSNPQACPTFVKFMLLNKQNQEFSPSKANKAKQQLVLLKSIKLHEAKSAEISLLTRLLLKQPHKLIKFYFKAKKYIHEELYKTNLCKSLDGVVLTIEQWVNITKKLFVDSNPIEKVQKISDDPLIANHRNQLPGVDFLEVLISELCFEKTGEKLQEKNQEKPKKSIMEESSIANKMNYKELVSENAKLKQENSELKERIEALENKTNSQEHKLMVLQEFQEIISKAYKDLMSYAHHLESSTRTVVDFVSLEAKNNQNLIEQVAIYRQDENQTLLPIFYLTLTESLDVLRKENIGNFHEDFSDFLETMSRKSFQERAKHVKRYDDFDYVLQLFRKKREEKLDKQ